MTTLYEQKKAALEEQIRLDNLGKAPAKEPKYEVVVPPGEVQMPHQPEAGLLLDTYRCGVCPQMHFSHPQAPFGQCKLAQRVLGATLYRTDTDSCSLTEEQKRTGKIGKFW